ncbi:MAG: hypothetical protein HS105_02440 [Chloracidobacterium sp.]|nr:hypothetical protein [Chloracidobacterium sp.]MCO5333799.1 hypothetical protein [Pyrinomonadaceae bacterium]
MKRLFFILAGTYLLVGLSSLPVAAQKEFTLRIDVSASDGGTVAGTKIRIASQVPGSVIYDVRAAKVIYNQSTDAFFAIDDMGFALIFVSPGTYKVYVENKFYKKKEVYISVPTPDQPGQLTKNVGITLEKDILFTSRKLTVKVLGEKTDSSGGLTTIPLKNANVDAWSPETESDFKAILTDASGIAVFNEPFVIGTEVQVKVKANGWETATGVALIGSLQDIDPNDRRTATSDQIVIKLREKKKVEDFRLVVEAVNSKTGKAIPGASVELNLTGTAGLGDLAYARGTTNAQGRTQPMNVTMPERAGIHTEVRIRVKARGFTDKWSDVPSDLVRDGGGSRLYVVHLEPLPIAVDSNTSGQVWNPYDLPAQFKTKKIERIQKLESYECWAPPNNPCMEPNIELSITVYSFVGGGSFWDRREYDRKRKAQADAGLVFSWACYKALWRNGRCG